MNKTIIFSNLGGMPFDQQTLEFMQSAYKDIALMLASMIGDNVIVAGCVATGDNVSAGWVIVGGELYPFEATQTGVKETFVIRELENSLVFEDGNSKPVEITKYARFGTADDAIRWDSLTRLNSYKALSDHIGKEDNPHKVTKYQVGLGNLPNVISDDPESNSSGEIASTAALFKVFEALPVILPVTSVDRTKQELNIVYNKGLDVSKYMPVAKMFNTFLDTDHDRVTGKSYINDYITAVSISSSDGKTYIKVQYNNSGMPDRTFYCTCTLLKIA